MSRENTAGQASSGTLFLRELFEKASKPVFARLIGFSGPIQPGASRLINLALQVDQPGVELGLRLKRGRQSKMNRPGFKRFERIGGPRRIDVRIKWRNRVCFPVNSDRKIDLNLNNNIGLWRRYPKLFRIHPSCEVWAARSFYQPKTPIKRLFSGRRYFCTFFARGYGGCKKRFYHRKSRAGRFCCGK